MSTDSVKKKRPPKEWIGKIPENDNNLNNVGNEKSNSLLSHI